MGILKSAARGLRNLTRKGGGKSLAEWFSGSKLNPGSYTEDIASGLGIRTRGPLQFKNAGRPFKKGTPAPKSIGGYAAEFEEASGGLPDQAAQAASGGYRNLTGAGYAAQGVGLAGAGTLGAKMIAGTEPTKDKHGVETGMKNESIIKARETYQKKIGGAKKFTPALLEHASKDSQWVKSAIKSMGMDKYKKLRARVAADKAEGNAAGVLHAALVDELAKVGDEEMMKQAATEDYVLPGLAKVGDNARRVIVITNQKGKDKKTSQMALQYEFDEGDDQ
jgi:hypothetical protein